MQADTQKANSKHKGLWSYTVEQWKPHRPAEPAAGMYVQRLPHLYAYISLKECPGLSYESENYGHLSEEARNDEMFAVYFQPVPSDKGPSSTLHSSEVCTRCANQARREGEPITEIAHSRTFARVVGHPCTCDFVHFTFLGALNYP